jgi:hypothetical protein
VNCTHLLVRKHQNGVACSSRLEAACFVHRLVLEQTLVASLVIHEFAGQDGCSMNVACTNTKVVINQHGV